MRVTSSFFPSTLSQASISPNLRCAVIRHTRCMDPMTLAIAATPAFIASAVEFVEATTIVLAVGITRGWKAPLVGTALAVLTLAVIVGTLGVALVTVVPEHL